MVSGGNKVEQKSFWSQSAMAMDRWLPLTRPASRLLVEKMIAVSRIKPGDSGLDIATGIGDPAIDIAFKVLPAGRVVGIDMSPERLEVARKRCQKEGLRNIEFIEGDFEDMQLSRPFDAAFCKWGLMFFTDVPLVLRKINSILRPGGTFTAAVWAKRDKVHTTNITADVLERLEISQPAAVVDPFRFADSSKLVGMLSAAGFEDITVEAVSVDYRFDSIERLQEYMHDANYTFRQAVGSASPKRTLPQINEAIRAAAEPYSSSTGIVLPNESTMVYCSAR